MRSRTLCVWINDQLVGQLNESNSVWSFRYADSWLENDEGSDLAPALPRTSVEIVDGSSTRPVQWFFENLLPEASARQTLLQELSHVDGGAFTLLQHHGQELAGALTLLQEDEYITEEGEAPLSFAELSRRIQALPTTPLTAYAPKKVILAGAQHKLMVTFRDGELFEPIGKTASTHILKPDLPHKNHYPHTAVNE